MASLLLLLALSSPVEYTPETASLATARTIFVGEVLRVGGCPNGGSGLAILYQEVDFRIERVLKGSAPPFLTVSFAKFSEGCVDEAEFVKGARVLVGTQRHAQSEREHAGILAYDTKSVEARAAFRLLGCTPPKGTVVFADTIVSPDHRRLELSTTDGVRAELGPDFFWPITNDESYAILGLELSPSKQRLAVRLSQDPEFPGNRYVVVLTAVCMRPEVLDSADSEDGGHSWGARDPVWLADDEIAFLSGSRLERAPRVFIKSLNTQKIRSIVTRDVPTSLRRGETGLVVTYEEEATEEEGENE